MEFRRIVEGPVSSGTLGGPAMFVVTLIVELAVDDADNDSRKKMVLTMAMKMRMRANSMLLGIPSLLN